MASRSTLRCAGRAALALAAALGAACAACAGRPPTAGGDVGWAVLFDGTDTGAWRGFRDDRLPSGWRVESGCLARVGPGGDIITRDQYGDFELELEWRLGTGGNSGIFFHVTEDREHVWETGPEFQVLDNAGHADGKNPLTSAGSNYALHAPARDATRPVGQWNRTRIEVRGARVKHFLNGELLLEYELGSPEWEELVAASKFASMPDYGRRPRGHIALQDHGDPVWYRDIRIRPLP